MPIFERRPGGGFGSVDVELADAPETATVMDTLHEAQEELWQLEEARFVEEVVLDKGYDKADLMREITDDFEAKTYVPERKRTTRRKWKKGQDSTRRAVQNNRRRMKRAKGRALQRKRSELVERSFAHVCDTGGLRRMTLRGLDKVTKRYVIHAAACNLALLMRSLCGAGTPRGLAARCAALVSALWRVWCRLVASDNRPRPRCSKNSIQARSRPATSSRFQRSR